jgi:hypothetical protein
MILVALAAGIIQMRVLYGSGMISKTWYDVVSLVGKYGAMPLPRTILHDQIPSSKWRNVGSLMSWWLTTKLG